MVNVVLLPMLSFCSVHVSITSLLLTVLQATSTSSVLFMHAICAAVII